MKKLLMLLLASAALLAACDKDDPMPGPELPLHDDCYYSDGVRYPLTAMDTKYYMIFKTADKQAVIDALNEYGVDGLRIGEYYGPDRMEDGIPELADCSNMIVESGIPLSYEMIPKLVYLAHYYLSSDRYEIGITNLISVYLAGVDDLEKLKSLAEKHRFMFWGQNSIDKGIYYWFCTKQTKGNALEIANLIYEKYGFPANPNFLIDVHPAKL